MMHKWMGDGRMGGCSWTQLKMEAGCMMDAGWKTNSWMHDA